MRTLLILPLLASLAAAEPFDAVLGEVRTLAVRPQSPLPFTGEGRGERVPSVARVTDAATWQSLLARVESRPTRVQTARVGATTYRISILTVKTALPGQDCPAGTQPENSVFVSRPVQGAGREVYPVRLAVFCRGETGVRDSFSLDADWEGAILDAAVYNGSLGLVVHPLAEPAGPAPAEPTSLDRFLARLVRQVLDAP